MSPKSKPQSGYVDLHRYPQTNVRFSPQDKELLQALAAHHGISATDLLTMLVRRAAREEGLKVKPSK
jgi:hypothetical protein